MISLNKIPLEGSEWKPHYTEQTMEVIDLRGNDLREMETDERCKPN